MPFIPCIPAKLILVFGLPKESGFALLGVHQPFPTAARHREN
jgi:hypothetical protein